MSIASLQPTIPALTAEGWQAFTNPRSIALVGASGRVSAVGFTATFLKANRDLGYAGRILPVNPTRDEVFGERCWRSLADLPEPAELVIIALPDEKVLDAVRDAIAHGAKALVIHSGGFGERGEEGAARERELQRLCAAAGVPAMGPNCLGILSYANRVSASSFRASPGWKPGPVAAISQSGSVAGILLAAGFRHGLSFLASTGNEAVTTTEDLISFAIDDPDTRVITAFVEALRRPRDLFALADRAHAAGKPIIVMKVGLTDHGAEVSRGHTGALAGSGEVNRQAFRQAGIMLVEDFDELVQTVELVTALKAPPKRLQLAILSTSGGELGAITDQCVEQGVALPTLAAGTVRELQEVLVLPDDVGVRNPVDVGTGFRNPGSYHDRMRACIRAIARDDEVDMVAVMASFGRADHPREMLAAAAAEASTLGKPVMVFSARSEPPSEETLTEVREAGIAATQGARETLRAIGHLARHRDPARPRGLSAAVPTPLDYRGPVFPGGLVPQTALFPLLAAQGVAVTRSMAARSAEEAQAAASALGGGIVMKIDTARVIHKSDIGGVALGVVAADAARRYGEIVAVLDPPVGAEPGEAVFIAEMLGGGVEFYIGAKYDEAFGAILLCGPGGRMVELLGRTAMLIAPFTAELARDAIARSGALPLLGGFRGGPVADLDRLAELMVRVGDFAAALGPRLDILDLNPVIINADHPGGCIADARLILKDPA
jgi:acyl-CoA synthetase (NDP forming)